MNPMNGMNGMKGMKEMNGRSRNGGEVANLELAGAARTCVSKNSELDCGAAIRQRPYWSPYRRSVRHRRRHKITSRREAKQGSLRGRDLPVVAMGNRPSRSPLNHRLWKSQPLYGRDLTTG